MTTALRASAAGLYAAEAAVELLIGHARWLVRDDFVDAVVETGEAVGDGEPLAWGGLGRSGAVLDAGQEGGPPNDSGDGAVPPATCRTVFN